MHIFVSGATGVVGRRAVRDLVAAGHEVTAVARNDAKAEQLRHLGARPVKVSLFDVDALREAMAGCEVVINLATSIPALTRSVSRGGWKENDHIRSEGSRNLVDAALAAGASRYIQESVTFLYGSGGDRWLDEEAAIEPTRLTESALEAEANAQRFTDAGGTGIVLRFGAFYGPDSEHTELLLKTARAGIDPLPGGRDDYISSISTDDAAAAVAAALRAPAGIYNVVDDKPLTRAEYDRALADALGVRRVRRLPTKGPEHIARSHRVSNRRFRSATGWAPRYPSLVEALPDLVEATVGRSPQGSRVARILLGFLVASAGFVGAWAQFAPASFYSSFPGFGRAWVAVDGPFNEHLIRDVGGLNLALAVLSLAALITLRRGLVRTAGVAWLIYGLPHLVYHLNHLTPLEPVDRALNAVALTAIPLAGAFLAWWKPSERPSRKSEASLVRAGRVSANQGLTRTRPTGVVRARR